MAKIMKARLKNVMPPIAVISILSVIIVWQILCQVFAIADYILPSPITIYHALLSVELSTWLEHIWATLRICLLGFLSAFVVSIMLSVSMVRFHVLRTALYPILVIVQSTPIVAIAPLIIVILGTDDLPRIVITFLITFFPMVVATTTGMLNTPTELVELSRSLGAPRYREFTQIRLPYAVPYIFSGLRIAITLAIVGTVVAEFVAAENGLGYYIQFSTSFFSIPNAFAGLFILLGISLSLFYAVIFLQKLLFPWSMEENLDSKKV